MGRIVDHPPPQETDEIGTRSKGRRSAGYTATAILLGITSVGCAVFVLPARDPALDLALTGVERLEAMLMSIVGFMATWALWKGRRLAPEYYLAWAVVVLGVSVHYSITVVPRLLLLVQEIMPVAGWPTTMSLSSVLWNFVLNAALLALGYWQLAKHRPKESG